MGIAQPVEVVKVAEVPEKAAEVVASEAGDALLVVVVDAADNSVTAAKTRSKVGKRPSRLFLHCAGGVRARRV